MPQAMAEQPLPETFPLGEVFLLLIITVSILYLVQLTGKVNLGIRIPGLVPPLRKTHRAILQKHIRFYRHLDARSKRQFERRVREFIGLKKFIPRQMPTVTSEMRVLLAATAVQITFGLPGLTFPHFTYILVYPDTYYSTINKRYHKGEVNPKLRAIVISWKSFYEGYLNPESGINVGLHEMAHALHLENLIVNKAFGFFDKGLWQQWLTVAEAEMLRIANGENTFLRKYAATDTHEFFAVAVEYFFEKPISFQANMPKVYRLLSQLLRLDTAALYNLNPTNTSR